MFSSAEIVVSMAHILYSAADEKRIWAIETTISAEENVSLLIDDAVAQIVGQLRKDHMISR